MRCHVYTYIVHATSLVDVTWHMLVDMPEDDTSACDVMPRRNIPSRVSRSDWSAVGEFLLVRQTDSQSVEIDTLALMADVWS